ncbi:MAG: hypothetical protein ACOYB0_10720, partial [Polynucleobacter sp.]
ALVPNGAFPLPNPVWTAEVLAVGAFMAIDVAHRATAAANLVAHGATAAFNHFALNLFVSNLRPGLRDELLKTPPANLYAAFQTALQLERIQTDPKKIPTTSAMPVSGTPVEAAATMPADTDADADQLDQEIDAMNFKLKNLKLRREQRFSSQRGRPQQNRQPPRSGGSGRQPQQRSGQVDKSSWKCRYCQKLGHGQFECFSRRRDNAPQVAADGTPYRTNRPNDNNSRDHAGPSAIRQVDQNPQNNPYFYVTNQQDFQ